MQSEVGSCGLYRASMGWVVVYGNMVLLLQLHRSEKVIVGSVGSVGMFECRFLLVIMVQR